MTKRLNIEEVGLLLRDGWAIRSDVGMPYQSKLVKGDETMSGLTDPVKSKLHRSGMLDPSGAPVNERQLYVLSAMGQVWAARLKEKA